MSSFLRDFSNRVHSRSITIIPIDDGRDIDIENISFLEYFICSRDAMTDDIIERYTGTTRISSFSVFIATQIVDTGRYTPIFLDECVHDRIEFEGRHSYTDILRDHIEGHSSET